MDSSRVTSLNSQTIWRSHAHIWVLKLKLQDENAVLNQSALEKQFTKLLFRGLAKQGFVPHLIVHGLFLSLSPENEFGSGVYATPDMAYAMQYVRSVGVLMIFDWSDDALDVTTRDIVGEEWKRTVTGNVRYHVPNTPAPPAHIRGAVSDNHQETLTCTHPTMSNITQYVGRPDTMAARAFESRLVGVVYFEL
jgi:hypothetical protein